jgi:hypothetical protein
MSGSKCGARVAVASLVLVAFASGPTSAATYYVRQTVGRDTNDGLSPDGAWEHISKLSRAMQAGDTAYVGPGLYRDGIDVENDGTIDKRITFIADSTGQHTGDPPGTVMITGADPVDETIFTPSGAPGVYSASFSAFEVWGVVEMDGLQDRYLRVTITKEYLVDKIAAVDIVTNKRSSFFYDGASRVLHLHTSDDRPPTAHEIELMRRGAGIAVRDRHYVTIVGFTFRHMQDAGIQFFKGSSDGLAVDNVSYGSRQGIRVYGARNMHLYGNTLFRNENCGAYFAAESFSGVAIGNTSYENIKGLRWGSHSAHGMVVDNALFDNHERGLSIEDVGDIVVRGNRFMNNAVSQLYVSQGGYTSESNCFENGAPEQLIADFYPYPQDDRFKMLAEYQRVHHEDMHSREGKCGAPPQKVDVHKLHQETTTYAERARRILSGQPNVTPPEASSAEAPGGVWSRVRSWLAR